jgi:hypothetical protein
VPELTPKLIDVAWRNYFGASHGFSQQQPPSAQRNTAELQLEDPLQI